MLNKKKPRALIQNSNICLSISFCKEDVEITSSKDLNKNEVIFLLELAIESAKREEDVA